MSTLKEVLRRSVNSRCTCGGGDPATGCPACGVWHDLQDRLEMDETGLHKLVEAAEDAAVFLFNTFKFTKTKTAMEAFTVHDKIIKALEE